MYYAQPTVLHLVGAQKIVGMYTLKYYTSTDDAQCFFFHQQVLKGPFIFALLVHFCWRVTHFSWSTLCSFHRLIFVSESQPPLCTFLSRIFFFLTSLVVWHFLHLQSSCQHFSWSIVWSKAYCGLEHDDSPTVGSTVRASCFTVMQQASQPYLLVHPLMPALAQKSKCYLWDIALAVASSQTELPNVLPKHNIVFLASPLFYLGQQSKVGSVLRPFRKLNSWSLSP